MNVSVTIPQLFYDLIARVIPGFLFLFGLQMQLRSLGIPVDYSISSGDGNWFGPLTRGLTFLFLAYLTGWLLSGLILFSKRRSVEKGHESKHADAPSINRQFQAVRILHPVSGFRVVKLRSEARMLEALRTGLVLLTAIVLSSVFATAESSFSLESVIRVLLPLAAAAIFYSLEKRAWTTYCGNVTSIYKMVVDENILSKLSTSH